MRLLPLRAFQIALIVAIAALAAPLIWLAAQNLSSPGEESFGDGSLAIDSGARIEIEGLREQIETLRAETATLRDELAALAARPAPAPVVAAPAPEAEMALPQASGEVATGDGNTILDAYTQVVLIANRREVNRGLTVGTPRFLEDFLGRPREVLSSDCEPITNPKLKSMIRVENVGPIRVQMLEPAIESLKRVFANVQATDPDLYARINTAGSLCVRQIRGTIGRISTHSFGLAVDLNIDGDLDTLGDGKTQLGLTILADFFKEEGWVWGAAFGREDSMHFEVSQKMLEEWRAAGKI